MKNAVLKYELSYWFKSPLFYALVSCFFLLSSVSMLGTGGFFDEPISSTQKVNYLNTPFALSSISFLFSKFSLFFVAIFAGFSLYRDYRNNTHTIIYTFPFSKQYYLLGKYLSTLIIISISGTFIFLGFGIAEFMLGVENPKITSADLMAYVIAFGVYFLPNLLIAGNFVFSVVGFTRNIFSAFITILCFALLQSIAENTLFNFENALILLDPFGQYAFANATTDWGFAMQNSNALPIHSSVVTNRLFWLLLSSLSLFIFYKKFNFQYDTIWSFKRKKIDKTKFLATKVDYTTQIQFNFSWKSQLKSFFLLLKFDCLSILTNWMFILICFFGVLTVLFVQLRVTNTGEFNLLPLTRILVGAPLSLYSIIIVFSTFLFSGILVHKAKRTKMNYLIDVSSVKNWQLFSASLGAIFMMQFCQLVLFMCIGIIIQFFNRYFLFEIDLYLFQLFLLTFPVLFIWNVCSVFVHTVFPNIFFGLFILLGIWLGVQSLEEIGIDTYLLKFNLLPALSYSDFYGYESLIQGYPLLLCYWLIFAFVLLNGIYLLWNRGSISTIKERLKLLKEQFNTKVVFTLALSSSLFLLLGFKIYKEEKKSVNLYHTKVDLNTYKAEWGKYQHLTLPKITNVSLEIDIYPEKRSFKVKGEYAIVNRSASPMDTILIRTGFDEITLLDWKEKAVLLKEDTVMKSQLFQLSEQLLPNDTIYLNFEIENHSNTAFVRNSNVLGNGSYLGTDILPRLGYQFIEYELPLNDKRANQFSYFHRDTDSVDIQTKITTSNRQVALAPGSLISEEIQNNRTTYSYKTISPVKFNFSFHSADFEIVKEKYRGVEIALYCTKNHTANTKFMINGLKASLDFNTTYFGKYPHQQIRIIEFPHTEGGYSATLTTNNIPASEMLFIINTEVMKDKMNLPFYVMSHELTHQWFGNIVMPADAEGAKMLTESITEYLSLLIYKNHFGEEMAKQFLEVQLNRYKRGKRNALEAERPLYKVLADEEYLAYGKGAIAFYLLAKEIGQEKMLEILRAFLDKYGNQHDTYPTSLDFLKLMKQHLEPQHHAIVDELFMSTDDFEEKMITAD